MSDLRETTFTWTVDNFDVAQQLNGECLRSPVFSIDAKKKTRFILTLYPRGSIEKVENHTSLFLKRDDNNEAKITLVFELCLIDASGKCTNVLKSDSRVFGKNQSWGFRQFCQRSFVTGPTKHDQLPDDEELTMRCRIWPNQDKIESEDISWLSCSEVLSQDFAKLFKSGMHSDLTIKAQRQLFKVHRFVLKARCPKLLSKLVQTKKLNVMALPNIKASSLQTILDYVYTGILESTENLEEVFEAANRYELADLKALIFPNSYSNAKTVIECFRVSFEWIIPDFKNFPQSNKALSYFLISDDIPKCNWMKVLLLTKENSKEEKATMLTFQKLRSCFDGVVHFKIQASDENDKVILTKESINVFENGKIEIPFDIGKEPNKMLVNGDLKFNFYIRVSTKEKSRQTYVQEVTLIKSPTPAVGASRNLKSLHLDLRHFYKSMKTGDVTLNVGSQKLLAHKAVLCSRSEVFCKMFQHDTFENQTNSVNIESVDEETMKSVLMYMYYGVTEDMDVVQAIKLYIAAERYLLLPLKKKCCQFLKSNVNADNGRDILNLADMHSDEGLKESVYEFMTAYGSEILQGGLDVLENKGDLYQDILDILFRCASLQKGDEELEKE